MGYTYEDLAESYINGNISHVRKILSGIPGNKTMRVYKLVAEWAGKEKAEMFLRSMEGE